MKKNNVIISDKIVHKSENKNNYGKLDALSDVLDTIHLSSTFYCRSELTAPWGLTFEKVDAASFHAIRSGVCWIKINENDPSILLSTGDIVIFPYGHRHIVFDDPKSPIEDIKNLISCDNPEANKTIKYGGGGIPCKILCGHFKFNNGKIHPLLSMLPPFIHLKADDGKAEQWLEITLNIISKESMNENAGSAAILTRATDILFIQAIRMFIQKDNHNYGWLNGLKCPYISRALAVIHKEPGKQWNIETLSLISGLSRSTFCEKFKNTIGEAPHKYLTRWRIHCGIIELTESQKSIFEIATNLGFQDEVSFSKVFKKYVGTPPGKHRRIQTNCNNLSEKK